MYSLARANVNDLKKHGLRGEDIEIVQIKAANELPDLEDDVLGVLQKQMDEDQAHALAMRANELMMVKEEEDFEFDFGAAVHFGGRALVGKLINHVLEFGGKGGLGPP